jgi:hypothetical protein
MATWAQRLQKRLTCLYLHASLGGLDEPFFCFYQTTYSALHTISFSGIGNVKGIVFCYSVCDFPGVRVFFDRLYYLLDQVETGAIGAAGRTQIGKFHIGKQPPYD